MQTAFRLSDKQYDILKWTCLIFLPAASSAYAAFAYIWGLPFGDKIPATIGVLETFLGALIGVSTAQYNKGVQPDAEADATEGGGVNG